MTQKEINEFLANTKVYVNGKSKEIQEKLFSFGYEWNEGGTAVNNSECPFLYINKNHRISYGCDMQIFTEYKHQEILASEILSLELTEPAYRPFKNQEECLNEMLKHKPFGWLRSKLCRNLGHISYLYENNNRTYIIWGIDEKNKYDVSFVYENYTFLDGTPFGIKEE